MALEGLGVAANVIAVVDLSAKAIGWCVRYAQDVKHAKDDKTRLSREVTRLNMASRTARDLLDGPRGARLKASQRLSLAVVESESQLRRIEKVLASEKTGLAALRWPFQSREVDMVVQDLQRCTGAISSALQVDQTSVLILYPPA